MKILHTIFSMNLSAGGPSSCTYELLKGINRHGISADILTIAPKERSEKIAGQGEGFIQTVPNDVWALGYSRNFSRQLSQCGHYDLFHSNGLWLAVNSQTAWYAKSFHKPYLLSLHGMLYPYALSVKKTAKKILRKLFYDDILQNAACIHVTCEQEKNHYRALGFTNPVAVIPNCLAIPENIAELRREGRAGEKKRIAFLGRFHPIKNLELLIDAWAMAGEKTVNSELLLVGNGDAEYLHSLERKIEHLHLKNVKLKNFVSGDDKYLFLASLRALVLISKMENFGMTVPEALMMGTPALTGNFTPWQGLPSHNCGWSVPTDAASISQAIIQIVEMPPDKLQEMRNAGIRYFTDNFSSEKVSQRMIDLYKWILTGKNPPDFVDFKTVESRQKTDGNPL